VAVDAQLLADLDRGLTLPASWYSDPEILRQEQEQIFRRTWQYAGVAEQVAEPGAFFTCRAGDVPIVVVRGRDGALRAFVNVCRHRGHEVASMSPEQRCGRRETLQCPYHAWTYDLDGALRAAPRSDREPGFDKADWSLLPARVETWGPLVFVNLDADAAPLAETLGDVPATMTAGGLDLSALEYRGRSREFEVEANWKIVVENFLECYHCPVAHKSFSRLIDVEPDAYLLTTSRWTSSQVAPVREGGRNLPYNPVGEIAESQFHYIWPNWTLNTFPGPAHVRVLVFQPLGPERTSTYVDGFWAPETPDEIVEEITAFGAEVGAEDNELVESVHRGLRTGMVPQGRLLPSSEHLLQHFQRLVVEALADAT
jgi:phenylpropionate dioxygenase-like ring-hydroxylating dioxygenase large terminal subunit